MRYEQREERGRVVDLNNRLVAEVTGARFYLSEDHSAPPERHYQINGRGQGVRVSLYADTANHAVNTLREWAQNHGRCLLTYYHFTN